MDCGAGGQYRSPHFFTDHASRKRTVPRNDPEIAQYEPSQGTTLDKLSLAMSRSARLTHFGHASSPVKRMRGVEFSNIALAAIAVVLVSMVLLVVVY
jgi:hypothetical protein